MQHFTIFKIYEQNRVRRSKHVSYLCFLLFPVFFLVYDFISNPIDETIFSTVFYHKETLSGFEDLQKDVYLPRTTLSRLLLFWFYTSVHVSYKSHLLTSVLPGGRNCWRYQYLAAF